MVNVMHTDTAMSRFERLPRVITEPVRGRSRAELGYALLGLPIGVAGFVFTVTTLSFSAGLAISFVGLPLMALTGLVSRGLGSGLRRFANVMIGTNVPPAQRFHADPGLFGWLGSCLKDGTAWRARLYLLLRFPVGMLGFITAVAFLAYGVGGITYPIWRPLTPCSDSDQQACHSGFSIGDYYFNTPFRVVLVFVAGVLITLATPWVVRAVLIPDRFLIRTLLGPTQRASRVEELQRSRAVAVDDSAATLRRIERDLHDGAQARLVALAMNVGLAREKLAEGGDPAEATQLLDTAHTTAKEAITELRDLARGIHPPVLDAGLDAALATLAAHSNIPVELRTSIITRPEPAIETMAYFCAAELLTNVAKHSGASRVLLEAGTEGAWLRLRVTDDGRGGARSGLGTGLTGLAERVGTVDGTLSVHSPDGGPTSVTVDVPLRSRGSSS